MSAYLTSLETLIEAGATPEMLFKVVKAHEEERAVMEAQRVALQEKEEAKKEAVRAKDRERKANVRRKSSGSPTEVQNTTSQDPLNITNKNPLKGVQKEKTSPSPKKVESRKTQLNLTTLPDHWRDECIAKHRMLNPEVEFQKFRDHHLARGSLMKDWMAAWRTWLRRGDEYRLKNNPAKPPPNPNHNLVKH